MTVDFEGHLPGDLAEVWALREDLEPHVAVGSVEDRIAVIISFDSERWLCLVDDRLVKISPAALVVVERRGLNLADVAQLMCE
jgi:hypothetical protein